MEDDADSLACLHGVRILTTCWIVLIHFAGACTFLRLSYNKPMVLNVIMRFDKERLCGIQPGNKREAE
jgi:hypothetical protein